MPLKSSTILFALVAFVVGVSSPSAAQAGPLLDWLFGRYRSTPAYPVGQPVPVGNGYAANYPGGTPGYAGNYGTYYNSQLPVIGSAGAGYSAPMPSGIAAATLPTTPTTLSYVPNYRTNSYRAPVTYYRPLLTTDPNTGAQVVAMAPCTSYEYMAQRVPTFGRSALFGSNTPPVFQPPAQALPTYTLPSGGVPLGYAAPAVSAPYSTSYGYGANYGSYSTLQPGTGIAPTLPGTTAAPAGAYPTAPLGQTPYYGSTSGGSSGNPSLQSVPGLVAPAAPTTTVPNYSYPSTGSTISPSYPSTPASPVTPNSGGVYPSNDPADAQPSLPSFPTTSNTRGTDSSTSSSGHSQLRSIVQQPRQSDQQSPWSAPSTSADRDDTREQSRQIPAMMPIPVPKGFEPLPRWNPGLLREEDMTASIPSAAAAEFAGQSKPIHWASFEQTHTSSKPVQPSAGLRPIASSGDLQLTPSEPDYRSAPESAYSQQPLPMQSIHEPPPAASPRRSTSGWKAVR